MRRPKKGNAAAERGFEWQRSYPSAHGPVNESLLERDAKTDDLRVKWLAKFQAVVPARIAARAIQLDRRLGQVTKVQLSSQIPLIQ